MVVRFNFTDTQEPGTFNVFMKGDSLLFSTDVAVTQMVMATQKMTHCNQASIC